MEVQMPKALTEDERHILKRLNGDVSTSDLVQMLFDLAGHLERDGQLACAKLASVAAMRLERQETSIH
ncbi:hypothetical protein BSL82_09280 [Tardibacter chloracetimidivorans]|uniref:DUF2783 domain-containing protein n=2 Tax=Tardibacter chloracetimidivorans TaxID=1921510 RepID=A0A1L3ZUZ4_9SPHN|nr:hypothetical protein BSL82_09280 [Tardibacter chloracetimidivorans]